MELCLFYAALCLVNVPLWYKFHLCFHTILSAVIDLQAQGQG